MQPSKFGSANLLIIYITLVHFIELYDFLRFNPFEHEFTIVMSSTTSRLAVDEDDLKWVKNYKKIAMYL